MINAGTLKRIADIQQPTTVKGLNGEDIKTWVTVARRFVGVKTRGGEETEQAQLRVQSVTSYEVYLRWETKLRAMNAKWRLVIDQEAYDIVSVENVGLANRKIKLVARAYG